VLKGDRIARLERAHDVRIVHPAVAALGVVALERPEDDVLAGDHEAAPQRLARLRREVACCAVAHPAGDYMIGVMPAHDTPALRGHWPMLVLTIVFAPDLIIPGVNALF